MGDSDHDNVQRIRETKSVIADYRPEFDVYDIYDEDDDGAVEIEDVNNAIDDYLTSKLLLKYVSAVIDAYLNE